MERIIINEQAMENAATQIDTATEQIRNLLNSIKTEVAHVSEVWDDPNAKVYMEKFDELQQSFPEFVASVHNLSSFLNGVAKAYPERVINPTKTAVNGTSGE